MSLALADTLIMGLILTLASFIASWSDWAYFEIDLPRYIGKTLDAHAMRLGWVIGMTFVVGALATIAGIAGLLVFVARGPA